MQAQNTPLKILLVDDDEGDVFMMQDVLEDLDLNMVIDAVSDGEQALTYLQQHSQSKNLPNLVLLDLNMPRMGGRELLGLIQQDMALCHLPVVILSTSIAQTDIQDCYLKGSNAYLVKPSSIDSLIQLLTSVSDFWGAAAELPGHSPN